MRNVKLKSLIALGALVAMSGGTEVMAASELGTANSTVVAPIAISAGTAMEFGTIAPTGSAGTVALAANDATTATNVDELSGTPAAGVFTVSGGALATYSITLPGSAVTLTGTPSGTMTIDNFVSDAGSALDGSGSATINVGATLNVGASQTAGTYTGTYTVSVNYN